MKENKVMVFGSFDLIHEGHRYLFKQAKNHGDKLIVVVGRDKTIEEIKGKKPHYSEDERVEQVRKIPYVNEVFLGSKDDKYKIIQEMNPDVICLGYDQVAIADKLAEELEKRNLNPEMVRLKEYRASEFSSSRIKQELGLE